MWKKWFSSKHEKDSKNGQDIIDMAKMPKHVAIIMDGNGRWAQRRGLPRTFGHRAGVESLREIVRTASDIGLQVLTVYAFSTENWKRPTGEVEFLMNLFSNFLDSEIDNLHNENVCINFIGNIDDLASHLQEKIEKAQTRTKDNTGLTFNVAVNYGGRAEITRAVQIVAQKVLEGKIIPAQITDNTIRENLYYGDLPDPDLLIRTGGDIRISNFLLWQSAYAELWFTDVNWPDFKPRDFMQAIMDFQNRDRRFGGINSNNTEK